MTTVIRTGDGDGDAVATDRALLGPEPSPVVTRSTWSRSALHQRPANHAALTPLSFLARAADVFAGDIAVSYAGEQQSWAQHAAFCRRFASALVRGRLRSEVVAMLMPNTPTMLAAHFAVPMAGCVLNTINTRLDPATVAYILEHSGARVLIADAELYGLAIAALALLDTDRPRLLVEADARAGFSVAEGAEDFMDFIAVGDPEDVFPPLFDEWTPITVNYTSGTTGRPKGVVYSHRGAYLSAVSTAVSWEMPKRASFLWTLPMFHCNGWCMPWLLALQGGRSVCMRGVDAARIVSLIAAERVTHYCGAPVVHQMVREEAEARGLRFDPAVRALIGGSPPPAPLIEGMDRIGVHLTHIYGLTETYGPATICEQRKEWLELELEQRATLNARQGVRYALQEDVAVLDPQTMLPVPRDGETVGEIMFRGNQTMMGYLGDAAASERAFDGGWFHSGDLAVAEPDGYARIKDRSKDIIISGGENISSVEVEAVLYTHPAIAAAAVVPMPHSKWGETPLALVEFRAGRQASEADLLLHCQAHLAGFKRPHRILVHVLPKTATGKIQKHLLRQAVRNGEIDGLGPVNRADGLAE